MQFKKCVFLDADTLVLNNIDELFDRDELSAAPDIGWPDCFNSGVFVFVPSIETYAALIRFANEHGSFDGLLYCVCFSVYIEYTIFSTTQYHTVDSHNRLHESEINLTKIYT